MPVALIAGSTGLVGFHLLTLLLEHEFFNRVIAVGRRPPPIRHQKLEFIEVDFDNMELADLPYAGHIFCCLGTTMKKAGSKNQFMKVDLEFPVNLAKATLNRGAENFYLISSIGADKHSLFFYTRVKGLTEEAIRQMEFKFVRIFRPSLLLGSRPEKRMGERLMGHVMKTLAPFMVGPLAKYRAIEASTVASAMYAAAPGEKKKHVEIFGPVRIRELASAIKK